jgi:hypothetical protein
MAQSYHSRKGPKDCSDTAVLTALALHALITWFSPGTIAKVYAYGAGGYTSIPNYGMFNEATIPPWEKDRHFLIQTLVFAVYAVASLCLGFGWL